MKILYLLVLLPILFVGNISSAWAVLIMTDDGMSSDCIIDDAASIKVKSSPEEIIVYLKDIRWMAGANEKRIRLINRNELIIGDIDDKMECKKEKESLLLPLRQILFFYYGKVDLDKIKELMIREYDDKDNRSNIDVVSYSNFFERIKVSRFIGPGYNETTSNTERKNTKSSHIGNLKVQLLPMNWEGKAKISSPFRANKPDFQMEFCLQGHSFGVFSKVGGNIFFNCDDKGKIYSVIATAQLQNKSNIPGSNSEERSLLRIDPRFLESKPSATNNVFLNFGNPFNVFSDRCYGDSVLFLFITADFNENTLELGEGNLLIYRTVSNVLKVPVGVEK